MSIAIFTVAPASPRGEHLAVPMRTTPRVDPPSIIIADAASDFITIFLSPPRRSPNRAACNALVGSAGRHGLARNGEWLSS
jgi:hypothetical protein